MNPEQFLTSATLRNKVKGFDYILDKVKELKMIPTTDFASQEMVAQYFDVSVSAINNVVNRHRDEVEDAGMTHQSKAELAEKLKTQSGFLTSAVQLPSNKGTQFTYKDGSKVIVPNRGLRTFSKSAVYAIGLLLQESPIAKQVRVEARELLVERDEKEQRREELAESDRIDLEIKDIAAKWGVSMVFKETQKAADYTQQMIAKKDYIKFYYPL